MKGIVFNLLEHVISRDHGEETWDALLDATGLDGAYASLGSYPDADLFALVGAAAQMLDISPDEVVYGFGRNALPLFAARYPELFTPHRSTQAFVLTLNEIIHPEVRKLYPGAEVPEFDFEIRSDTLVLSYRSARKLCSFAEGLITGTADHYRETITIHQPCCMKRGDERCLLEIAVAP